MIDLRTTTRVHLTVEEFAEIVGKSRRAVYYWIAKGQLHTVVIPVGRRVTIDEARRVARLVLNDYTFGMPPRPQSVQRMDKSA